MSTAVLRADRIGKSFGQTVALQQASVEVTAGEIVAVMGPSGSGKSTLLHCLAGIYTSDTGTVWFDGRRLDSLSDAARTRLRRTAFGFVFQFGQLVPELTAVDNVALPLLLGGVRRRRRIRAGLRLVRPAGAGRLGATPHRRTVRRAGRSGWPWPAR